MSTIDVVIDTHYIKIKMPQTVDAQWADEFSRQSTSWLLKPVETYLLDCSELVEIKVQAYRQFVQFAKICRDNQRKIFSLNLSQPLAIQVKSNGLGSCFNPINAVEDLKVHLAPKTGAKPKIALDVKLINPFIQATVQTLDVTAKTKSQVGKPYLLKVDEKSDKPSMALVGVISISTAQIAGSVTLSFPEATILKIYQNLVGEDLSAINSDVQDAVGELLNIIYGNAKTVLNRELGLDLQPVLPTVLAGDGIRVRQSTKEKIIILPFTTDYGPFQIEISMENV